MNRRNKNKLRGFTLLEVLIALAIFSGLLVAISSVFGGFVKNYKATKLIQKDLENAQYAIGIVSKVLRTSTVTSAAGTDLTSIQIFDNSQGSCFNYRFQNNNLEVAKNSSVVAQSGDCAGASYSAFQSITGSPINATGSFVYVRNTNNTPQIGMITMRMDIGSIATDLVHMQTTVSLRDYDKTK